MEIIVDVNRAIIIEIIIRRIFSRIKQTTISKNNFNNLGSVFSRLENIKKGKANIKIDSILIIVAAINFEKKYSVFLSTFNIVCIPFS